MKVHLFIYYFYKNDANEKEIVILIIYASFSYEYSDLSVVSVGKRAGFCGKKKYHQN